MKQTYILHPGETVPLANLLQDIAQRNPGKDYRVTFEVYKDSRSDAQNRYYWGVVLPTIQAFIHEHRGEAYSCDDIHEWMRDQFLPTRTITIKGKSKVVRPSTASLKVDEFSEYLEKVICFAAQSGIVISEPEWKTA